MKKSMSVNEKIYKEKYSMIFKKYDKKARK